MSIDSIRKLVKVEMAEVDGLIEAQLDHPFQLINDLGHHIIQSGGKRLRPLLVLLCSQLFPHLNPKRMTLATVIEFVHTATLLHDDVVDHSSLRRGKATANEIWGNKHSVLVGDFLYSRAVQLLVSLENIPLLKVFGDATNALTEGEILQLSQSFKASTSQETYMDIIRCKTAELFQAGCKGAAILAEQPEAIQNNLGDYGLHLGLAFQIIDDVLDYSASPEEMGKNCGDDLAEGKVTLPLIYAMQHADAQTRKNIEQSIEQGRIEDLKQIQDAIAATDAIRYTNALANEHKQKALQALANLEDTPAKQALQQLAEFAITRRY